MAHLDIAPPAPAAPASGEPATVAVLRARLRQRARHLAHLAHDLPDDLTAEQRLLVERAVDAVGGALAQTLAAAGLVRRGAPLAPSAEVLRRASPVAVDREVHFVGANRLLPEEG